MENFKSLETYEFAELGMNGDIPEGKLAELVARISSSKATIIWGIADMSYALRLRQKLASVEELKGYDWKYERKTLTAIRKEGYCKDA